MDIVKDALGETEGEVVMLSDIFYKQKFRKCFAEHLCLKIERLSTQNANIKVLRSLQLKLLEPVMFHLRNTIKSSDKYLLLQYLMKVLKLTLVHDVGVFFHLYLLIFSQIFEDGETKRDVSEELKMIAFDAGILLLQNSERRVLKEALKQDSAEKYSIGIFLSVQCAKNERNIRLRLNALNFLLLASQYEIVTEFKGESSENLGDLFMLYLPGILAPLQEIILGKETQHHLITAKALACWGHIICLVLNDSALDARPTENDILKDWITFPESQSTNEDTRSLLQGKKRTSAWLRAASKMLKPLIAEITDAKKHSHSKCRLELTKVMVKLYKNCRTNLETLLPSILEVLVASSSDDEEEVSFTAKAYLSSLMAEKSFQLRSTFQAMEKNLYMIVNRLPGIIHSENEKLILSNLKCFSGYLKILGEENKSCTGVISPLLLKKMLHIIEMGMELTEDSNLLKLDFPDCRDEEKLMYRCRPWKIFRHFTDESIRFELESICQLLSKHYNSETILDHLLDAFAIKRFKQREILLITNQVILGMNDLSDRLADHLIDFYLGGGCGIWPSRGNVNDDGIFKNAPSNVTLAALKMEGIRHLAINLKLRFRSLLLKSLYVVMEGMGNIYPIVRLEAEKTVMAISDSCGFGGDIQSLIKNNIDYLMYHLTKDLKRNDEIALGVMTVLINNTDIDTVINLQDIVENIVKGHVKISDSSSTILRLRMLRAFAKRLRKWLEEKTFGAKRPESHVFVKNHAKELLANLRRIEEEALVREEEPEETSSGMEKNERVEESKTLPKHVAIVVSVCNYCLRHLTSTDIGIRVLVLEVLEEGLAVLSDWENELLPVVHKIWSPLAYGFYRTSDSLLIKASFGLLCTLARTSKQFIRTRALREVMPLLQSFLVREAPNITGKDSSSSGRYFTQNFKLQRDLLENLGNLTADLDLFEKQTDLVAESGMSYLSALQADLLQEKCRQLFSRLQTHDPYLIWLKLHPLLSETEYSENVRMILSEKSSEKERQ